MCRYGVVIDGERGNRPHILSQEELLNQAVCLLLAFLTNNLVSVCMQQWTYGPKVVHRSAISTHPIPLHRQKLIIV